ncbi:DNA-3-methyladenine glycosylase 2 family protein [Myxococcus qinghaiensis]|uniref:DNA-3-methyladenine glycosylase 2 family protein n=1 Tax=Myxococcus qinghaiensis TaxID=2906758 RepID=UPI0020A6F28A|nr:AlkA N-terminal domain-containing protein [Myxococcus qinghaiensis]MCP3167654.1 helix-turn-helix domain-containing protein [Myxococcus qinghaiensis]
MDLLDSDACYRVLQTRDARFDGRLFVAVTSTGIYCRPICPARTPKQENCRFFASAAASQEEGFRPCLRCRPETAPDLASWRGTSNTVSRALALIAEGALDGGEAGVDALAERLGVGGRQLRRLFKQHLGATPVAVAQTRRVLFAKQLIQETRMPLAEVALASGFGSIRRFNETFQGLYQRPPGALRRKQSVETTASAVADAGVTLRLRYRPPYDWAAMLSYLSARAIQGVEQVSDARYLRTVSQDGAVGTVEVTHEPARNNLVVKIRFPRVQVLPAIIARVRRVFDVGADIEVIGAHLSKDPFLAPLVALRPGLRAPGAWDGFELAVRAILGQQVTVEAARKLAGKLVVLCAEAPMEGLPSGLSRAFPSPERVVATDLGALGMPSARKASLKALAQAALADPLLFHPFGTVEEGIARLRSIRGVGEWTAQYIALRALRETDAFPASDVALLRSAATDAGARPTPEDLIQRAEPWRPWRAYAAQHLWAADPGLRPRLQEVRHG